MSLHYGIGDKRPFGYVEGKPQMSDVTPDAVDQIKGGFQYQEGSGTQSGSHPAKSQPKTLRPLE